MKKKNDLVSIIVNCFNGEKFLKDCILSVKKQSYVKQISRERSEGVEVLEVSSNKGVKIEYFNFLDIACFTLTLSTPQLSKKILLLF